MVDYARDHTQTREKWNWQEAKKSKEQGEAGAANLDDHRKSQIEPRGTFLGTPSQFRSTADTESEKG